MVPANDTRVPCHCGRWFTSRIYLQQHQARSRVCGNGRTETVTVPSVQAAGSGDDELLRVFEGSRQGPALDMLARLRLEK
jgi:hypothetical protein